MQTAPIPRASSARAGPSRPSAWSRVRAALGDPARLTTLLAAAVAGLAAAMGAGTPLLIAVFLAGAIAMALVSWRRSIRWALYYLPFSGLLPLLLYPNQGPATLLKDIAFIGPAYLGAIVAVISRRERLTLPRAPWLLLSALSALVVVQAANPKLERALVGPIGAKVWLFYLPLIVLGYHMFSEKGGLQQVLKWMTILAMVPCVLGILEALLIYGGQSSAVYRLYGAAAAATTENFTTYTFGTGSLTRVSSIFTFTAQYFFFATASIAVAWAAWRGNREDRLMRWFGPVAIAVATFASMTSGLRAAFIFAPVLFLMIALLEGYAIRGVLLGGVGSVLAVAGTLLLLGISVGPLASLTSGHTSFILDFFDQGIQFGLHHSIFGLGSGADTNQARYAFSTNDYGSVYAVTGGVWYESWYLKALLELGVVGLGVFVLLTIGLVRRSLSAHFAAKDPESRSMSAAFAALFLWTLIFSVKTAGIDEDPLNIYIWLFLGIQWRLATMQTARRDAATATRRRVHRSARSHRRLAGATPEFVPGGDPP